MFAVFQEISAVIGFKFSSIIPFPNQFIFLYIAFEAVSICIGIWLATHIRGTQRSVKLRYMIISCLFILISGAALAHFQHNYMFEFIDHNNQSTVVPFPICHTDVLRNYYIDGAWHDTTDAATLRDIVFSPPYSACTWITLSLHICLYFVFTVSVYFIIAYISVFCGRKLRTQKHK